MADVKISGLPAATTPLGGTEVLPIVQGTTTKKVSVDNLTAGKAVSALSVTATNLKTSPTAANLDISGTTVAATGTDANIDLNLNAKGSGVAYLNQRWGVNQSGALVASADNTYDIGNGASDPRDVSLKRTLSVGAGSVGSPAITTTGDPNTGIFFPAADTIAFTEGGAESMRVDSSGSFIVGDTSNYGVRSLIAGAGAAPSTGNGSNNIVLALRDTTAGAAGVGAGIAFLGNDGTNTGVTFGTINGTKEVATSGNYAASLVFKTRANGLSLVEQMRIASNGNVTLATGNLVIGTSGKGIDFSATAGTGTSELLADYEEGTWTPVLTLNTPGDSAVTYTSRYGNYVKIGKQVTVTGYIAVNTWSTGTGSGGPIITGLPYTVGTNIYNISASLELVAPLSTGYRGTIRATYNTATLDLLRINGNVNPTTVTAMDNPANGATYAFTVTYFV